MSAAGNVVGGVAAGGGGRVGGARRAVKRDMSARVEPPPAMEDR